MGIADWRQHGLFTLVSAKLRLGCLVAPHAGIVRTAVAPFLDPSAVSDALTLCVRQSATGVSASPVTSTSDSILNFAPCRAGLACRLRALIRPRIPDFRRFLRARVYFYMTHPNFSAPADFTGALS